MYQASWRSTLIRFFVYAPLIAIASVTCFYLYKYYHAVSVVFISEVAVPDLTAKDIDAWRFDLQGQPQYRLLSATALHYNKDNLTDFTQVTGYFFVPKESPWQVKADTAQAVHGYGTIYLIRRL